ncbi:hypothetical protein AB0F72_13650 [Actinoplanes sp. NPDC023936]|uniref:hypothetical protein n=1 Tax=Actinoplanes sp. NPDC023936 TaxID=3154910 RepID=UPI003407D039
MISVQEFARRLNILSPGAVTSEDIEDLADAAGVRIDPGRGIDAAQAQQMLDHLSPPVPVSGTAIVASQWTPETTGRVSAPPMVFSNPGAVDAPSDPPARPRKSGQTRNGRPGSRSPRR